MSSSEAIVTSATHHNQHPSTLLTYARLLRIPNVFTAMADIGLAALATAALPNEWLDVLLVLLTSSCLYCAGMVWNDYFDLEQDRRERSFRPIPSGRVTTARAFAIGSFLVLAGIGLAAGVDWRLERFPGPTLGIALALVSAILLYDGWLKRTPVGPVAMGSCRFLNILLGLSVAPSGIPIWGLLLAIVVGLYIAGVTWFARTEARLSNQSLLTAAAFVMFTSLLLALAVPILGRTDPLDDDGATWWHFLTAGQFLFPYLLVVFGFYLAVPIQRAIVRPIPANVQSAVKRCVLGLILFDALLVMSLVGTTGLLLVLLLIPARLLGRWVYST